MAKAKSDGKAQSRRFIEKAKEVADENAEDAFERAVKKVLPPKKGSS